MDRQAKAMIGLLVGLAVLFLVMDVNDVMRNNVDLNAWVPFFMPAFFGVCAAALARFLRWEAQRRHDVKAELHRHSAFSDEAIRRRIERLEQQGKFPLG